MMLWFCAGTAGGPIKIYPLMRMAEERGLDWFMLPTGQSAINFFKQWDDFGLPRSKTAVLNHTTQDLQTSKDALRWFGRAAAQSARSLRRKIKAATGKVPGLGDFWLVHGDTLSTLLGASYARRLSVPLVHIEAGLRSSDLFKPFPEEINRRLVSRFAHFHFTQDDKATENLKRTRVKGQVIETHGNTLIDAIDYVMRDSSRASDDLPNEPFIIANIHRFENLHSQERWNQILDILVRAAKQHPVLLVQHPPTEEKLNQEPENRKRLEHAGVRLLPRQPFTRFIRLLARCEYVLSDGGSNQEECFYLGKPCLILRDSTERFEGLSGPCLLTRFEAAEIDRFFARPKSFETPPVHFKYAPSAIILDTLKAAGQQTDRRKPA